MNGLGIWIETDLPRASRSITMPSFFAVNSWITSSCSSSTMHTLQCVFEGSVAQDVVWSKLLTFSVVAAEEPVPCLMD